MSHESASRNTPPDLRDGGELRRFDEGVVDVVYTGAGTGFTMAEITDHFAKNSINQESCAAVIQVVGADGRPENFYMDRGHVVSKARPWLVARLDRFPTTDPEHDITVGEPWHSPFGTTGSVHAIALPYNHGVTPDMVTDAPQGSVSPTRVGRRIIDQALKQ